MSNVEIPMKRHAVEHHHGNASVRAFDIDTRHGRGDKHKVSTHDKIVIEYIQRSGHLVCISDDFHFLALLRNTVAKQLGQTAQCLSAVHNIDHTLRTITSISQRCFCPVVFIEHLFKRKDMGFMVRQIKNTFKDLRVIMLTSEKDRDRLILLHEIGADNFISKPVSVNGLIEKVAATIKPKGKVGQLVDEARRFIDQGNIEQAFTLCRQALELKPDAASVLLLMGDAFRVLGKWERAQDAYENACSNAPMYMEPLKKLAEMYEEMGDAAKRLRCLERLDALSPLNVDRKIDMGEIHLSTGNTEAAEHLFETAIAISVKEAAAHISDVTSRVTSICAEIDPDLHEKFLRRSLEKKGKKLDKNDIDTFNQLGIILRNKGQWREAIVEYKKALSISPCDENLHYNMGMAYAEGRDFLKSQASLLKALAFNPKLPEKSAPVGYNIACVFRQVGAKQRVVEFLEATLQCDPDFEPAKRMLAEVAPTSADDASRA